MKGSELCRDIKTDHCCNVQGDKTIDLLNIHNHAETAEKGISRAEGEAAAKRRRVNDGGATGGAKGVGAAGETGRSDGGPGRVPYNTALFALMIPAPAQHSPLRLSRLSRSALGTGGASRPVIALCALV